MKKAATNVTGRAGKFALNVIPAFLFHWTLIILSAISEVNFASLNGQRSRQHIVFKVYPFNNDRTSEVMLYGMSKYVYEQGATGEMSRAARLCFDRSSDESKLVNLYHIFPVRSSNDNPLAMDIGLNE